MNTDPKDQLSLIIEDGLPSEERNISHEVLVLNVEPTCQLEIKGKPIQDDQLNVEQSSTLEGEENSTQEKLLKVEIPAMLAAEKCDKRSEYFITGLEVCNSVCEPEEDLVESLIVKSVLSTIVGSSGVGKSMLSRQIALAIVNKEQTVIGFGINSECHEVVYCSTEDSIMQWKKQLVKYNPDGSKDESLSRLHLIFGSDTNHFVALDSILKERRIALVIIDVYSDVFSGNPNDNIQVRGFLKKYKNLAHNYGTSFLLVHHIGKGTEKNAPSKNSIIGSQGYESSVRSAFELRADQYDPTQRHLCILKQNYLAEESKGKSFVLVLKEDLTFEFTGERKDLAFLAQTNQKVASNDSLKSQVLELHRKGLSSRSIEKSLEEQGLSLKKSRICDIINEQSEMEKAEPVIVLTPIMGGLPFSDN